MNRDSDGVPRSPDALNWSQDVETWWAGHWMNPLSSYYVTNIISPRNVLDVDATYAGDLQAAIDALPATGGTLKLGAASSYGRVVVTGKSNVHFIGGGATKIRGVQLWGAAICQTYTTWFTGLRTLDSTAVAAVTNRPRNFYFSNIIFDGQNDVCSTSDNTAYNTAVFYRGVREILFDSCTFQNYVDEAPGGDWTHPGTCAGNGFVEGLWFRNCVHNGSVHEHVFCDGLHDGGAVGCTFSTNAASHFWLDLNNNDFSIDLDGSGALSDFENRHSHWIAFYGNTFARSNAPAGNEAMALTAGHVLFKGNTQTGTGLGARVFLLLQTREYNPYGLPSGQYQSYGSVVDGNTFSRASYVIKVDGQSGQTFTPPASAGHIGYTTVKNNVMTGTFTGWVSDVAPLDQATALSNNTP
jgi:hypothetical protein